MTTQYCDRAGHLVTEAEALDDDGQLRSGFGVRVPLQMCDSFQRDVAEHFGDKRRRKTLHRDPLGREAGTEEEEEGPRRRKKVLYRDPLGREAGTSESEEGEPRRRRKQDASTGFTDSRGVYFEPDPRLADAQQLVEHIEGREEALRQIYRDGRAAAEQARQDMIRDMASGREVGPPGAYPYSPEAEGTRCTINGEDGTLVREGDYLVCKPKRQAAQSHDADPRAAAYAEMLRDTDYRTRSHRNA